MTKKYIVRQYKGSVGNKRKGMLVTYDDYLRETDVEEEGKTYGIFDTEAEAIKCYKKVKYFVHDAYKTGTGYEVLIEYVAIDEVDWDEDENEERGDCNTLHCSFEDFKLFKKYIVRQCEGSITSKRNDEVITYNDYLRQPGFTEYSNEKYGTFDTEAEAMECYKKVKYFVHDTYKTVIGYEVHIEYVSVDEVDIDWDEEDDEEYTWCNTLHISFDDFKV